MNRITKIFAASLVGAAMACGASVSAVADTFPTKPIRFVVPIPAGGSTDVLARDVASRLQQRLGQPVVVENRPGGSSSIGTAFTAEAPADGYTILLVNASHAISPHVYKNLPYHALDDFDAVSLMTELPMGLVVNDSVPARTLEEFVALAKDKPGSLSFASAGNGGVGHLTGELFMQQSGTRMLHVPYRGSAPALNDLIAGQVPVMFADVPLVAPHVKSGKLRVLAVTSRERSPSLPDVPAFNETQVKGMDLSIWIGVLAPAGTPAEVRDRLSREIAQILQEPDMAESVRSRGFTIVGSTPDAFDKVIRDDYAMYGEIVRKADIRAE